MQKSSNKIEILELLRFVAMTEVFLIHYMNDYVNSEAGKNMLMVSGELGVAFFFMITAYLLVKTSKPEKKGFLKKKAKQLLPKYEIILFAVFIASLIMPSMFRTFDVSLGNFVRSVFLIPYQTEGVPFSCPMLPVAWTLVVQIFVYIAFWVFMKLTKSTIKTAGSMVAFLGVLCAYGYVVDYDNLFAFTYCRFYMLYFIAGFVVAILEHKLSDRIKCVNKGVPMWMCIFFLVAFLGFSCVYERNLLSYILSVVIFGGSVLFGKMLSFPKTVIFMGSISYSFYLIHYLTCKVFTRLFDVEVNSISGGGTLVLCFALTVLLSVIFDYVVDRIMPRMIAKVGKING